MFRAPEPSKKASTADCICNPSPEEAYTKGCLEPETRQCSPIGPFLFNQRPNLKQTNKQRKIHRKGLRGRHPWWILASACIHKHMHPRTWTDGSIPLPHTLRDSCIQRKAWVRKNFLWHVYTYHIFLRQFHFWFWFYLEAVSYGEYLLLGGFNENNDFIFSTKKHLIIFILIVNI